jgi:hypothetical protein
MRFLTKISVKSHFDDFPALAENMPSGSGEVVGLHYGERGGKRFGPLRKRLDRLNRSFITGLFG